MSHAHVHPGILGFGLARRIAIAGAVVVLLWGALAWAVGPT